MALLFTSFSNGYFHLTYALTRFVYVPGVLTGAFLCMPLALLAARYAVMHNEINGIRILLAFVLGLFASFLPFIHIRIALALAAF